jgi:ketosteroid isomerase-like protein
MTDFLVAEAGIRQLHTRCADAVWRKDSAAFGDCFTKDGEWRISGMILKGRDHIAQTFGAIMGSFEAVLMNFHPPALEVGDGVAEGRTYTTELSAFANGERALAISTYYERYVLQGDRWRFAWRLFHMHYLGPPDLSGTYYRNTDYGPPPAMPGLDETSPDHSGMGASNS